MVLDLEDVGLEHVRPGLGDHLERLVVFDLEDVGLEHVRPGLEDHLERLVAFDLEDVGLEHARPGLKDRRDCLRVRLDEVLVIDNVHQRVVNCTEL